MTIHTHPNINGGGFDPAKMKQFESGAYWLSKVTQAARLAVQILPDDEFARIIADELRNRPARVTSDVIARVTK
jgi:hypothetical protein